MTDTAAFTPLSALLARRQRRDADVSFDVPDDWLQGRTSFGGLVSTFAVQAMRDAVATDWPDGVKLRALQSNFIAPVEQGLLTVSVRLLREGRNVRQVQATVRQGDTMSALIVGVFGLDRETTLTPLNPLQPAPARAIGELPQLPFVRGVRPNFLVHFDTRWSEGTRPFSGHDGWTASIHLRLTDADAASLSPELATVLMADVSPSPAISHFDKPSPTSSVSWSLEPRPLPPGDTVDGWWRADNEVIAASGGYVNQRSSLWSPGGSLAALAYQVVTVYG